MIIHGDCLEKLKNLADNSVDAVVTDPPYGWRFMGKAWDAPDINKMAKAATGKEPRLCVDGKWRKPRENCASIAAGKYDERATSNRSFQVWTEAYCKELLRVLKPGGHMLVFCGPRTYHRMASGVEDAGFEIRDQLQWIFGSGFPKSHNLTGNWKGFGSALKPSNEPIVLARKPLDKGLTIAQNVEKWGCGAINIDGSRIATDDKLSFGSRELGDGIKYGKCKPTTEGIQNPQGRWPANVLFGCDCETEIERLHGMSGFHFDDCPVKMLDEQSGDRPGMSSGGKRKNATESMFGAGGASRFFYVAKASKRERNAGLEGMPEKDPPGSKRSTPAEGRQSALGAPRANHHPTVKPIKLMEYLVRMITPPGGIVLDPFMGSGSTGVAAKRLGFEFIGIEMNDEYVEIAEKRIAHGGI